MKNTALFLAYALLAATSTTAAPSGAQWDTTPARKAGSSKFGLQQMRNEKYRGDDATGALIKAHMRFGKEMPAWLRSVVDNDSILKSKFDTIAAGGETASAQAVSPESFDSQYVIPVEIGTPPQVLPLNLDTGSSDFWCFSSLTIKEDVNGQVLYHPEDSATSQYLVGQTWGVTYGDGSGAGGIVFADRAAIGEVVSERQAVQLAINVSDAIASDNFFAGILGMASSSANTVEPNRQTTFLDNIKDDLDQPVFTANLKKGVPGNYNFGFIDESEYIGEIAYTPINLQTPFWDVVLSGTQVGRDGEFVNTSVSGIVDTGTSLLMMPQEVVDAYYAEVPGSYFDSRSAVMLFPCEQTLPDFIFGVGDYRGIIPGYYINYANLNETYCYGGLQSSEGIPFAVFGDVLIKAQLVVFDRGNLQVGFANKETVPPSS